MRNIATREGYEFWDKICAVQSYAFLLSPDGRRVVKTPDIGDWIDKHDAQVIVDHAQEEFNVMKAERDALQIRLTAAAQMHPFAEKVIRKLERFQECADDGQGADIGRHWFDLLTQLGLLNRVQRSPALWEMTQQGEDALELSRQSAKSR